MSLIKVKDKFPKVTIIIPVYNGENYIRSAIESAVNQSYSNLEIIVIDDGSNDNTKKILEQYSEKIIYFSKENGGVSSALNLGIELMTGEYFSWLSHDDYYLPNKISNQVEYLMNNKINNPVLYGNYYVEYFSGMFSLRRKVNLNNKLLNSKPIYSLLRAKLNGITMLIPKETLIKNGKFNESLLCLQDYDYWSRLIMTNNFVHINNADCVSRVHNKQTSRTEKACLNESIVFWAKLIDIIPNEIKIIYEGTVKNFDKKHFRFLKRKSLYGVGKTLIGKSED